jgi:hypothetical protein
MWKKVLNKNNKKGSQKHHLFEGILIGYGNDAYLIATSYTQHVLKFLCMS